jgi:hypothetical protein
MTSGQADVTETVSATNAGGDTAIASPTQPDELRTAFARDGVALVRSAFDPDQAAAMRCRRTFEAGVDVPCAGRKHLWRRSRESEQQL